MDLIDPVCVCVCVVRGEGDAKGGLKLSLGSPETD